MTRTQRDTCIIALYKYSYWTELMPPTEAIWSQFTTHSLPPFGGQWKSNPICFFIQFTSKTYCLATIHRLQTDKWQADNTEAKHRVMTINSPGQVWQSLCLDSVQVRWLLAWAVAALHCHSVDWTSCEVWAAAPLPLVICWPSLQHT